MDVKTTNQSSERREKISLVSQLHCTHDLESNNYVVLKPPGCDSSSQGKNKKKKKKQNDLHNLKRLVDFNTSELLKLDKEKSVSKKCPFKKQSCSTFVESNGIVEGDSVVSKDREESGNSDDSTQLLTQKIVPCLGSPPQKSALRGAYGELGFGIRPKLHVRWAPSVWEPPPSTVSHTVNNTQPKHKHSKKDLKHGRKGKRDHKKDDKKKQQQLIPRRSLVIDEQVEARVASKVLSRCDVQELQHQEPNPHMDNGHITYECCEGADRESDLFSEKWCSRQLQVQ